MGTEAVKLLLLIAALAAPTLARAKPVDWSAHFSPGLYAHVDVDTAGRRSTGMALVLEPLRVRRIGVGVWLGTTAAGAEVSVPLEGRFRAWLGAGWQWPDWRGDRTWVWVLGVGY
jgi:hypothetical protein